MDWTLMGVPVVNIALRTLVVYLVILLGLRVTGKREIGQFTPFDLVMILLISNAVQNAMVGSDTTLLGGVVAAVVLLVVNLLLSLLVTRNQRLEHVMVGFPTVLVSDGTVIARHMSREGVTMEELMAALREHGIMAPQDVALAVLEIDGSISVVPKSAPPLRTRKQVKYLRRKG
ncbi:MAG: DUF421 domain-containing protein [Gaiellales bacterium]|nr:DUF421 domain-containing protein [Gaiellales bacterium]